MQLGDFLGGERGGERRPVDFVVEVGAEVPGHRLQPGDRVGRRPPFGLVAGVLQAEHRVLEGELAALVGGQVGVDAVGVGLVVAERDRVEQLDLLLGDRPPAEGADEAVGADLALAEQLGEPPARHVPAEVHLPETVLGVHVPLRHEQVRRRLRDDLRDPGVVAVDGGVGFEPRKRDLTGERREGAHEGPDAQPGCDQDEAEHDPEQGEKGPSPAVSPAARCVGTHITPL